MVCLHADHTPEPFIPLLEEVREALSGSYAIEREIGAGGMATVYLARDLKHDRKVAVKVLRGELTSALGKERFPREIRIIAQLSHPHILPLHDSGEAGGFLYFVMPFVEGESLRARLEREGQLPVHDAVRLMSEIVDALAYAHRQGVVHRDIKPDNVMLSGRHALITDFGVAKAVSAATEEGAKHTTVGIALGTPTAPARRVRVKGCQSVLWLRAVDPECHEIQDVIFVRNEAEHAVVGNDDWPVAAKHHR